jgi:rare lipoprotein A
VIDTVTWSRSRPRAAPLMAGLVLLTLGLPPAQAAAKTRSAGPETATQHRETGLASWYGAAHQGRRTASGERFDRYQLTAAHPSLPFSTILRVTEIAGGRSVLVRVNDRGPNHPGRAIDLSEAAARAIGMARAGIARVEMVVMPRHGTPVD